MLYRHLAWSCCLLLVCVGCQHQPSETADHKAQLGGTAVVPPASIDRADAKTEEISLPTPALEVPLENGQNGLSREELDTGWIRLFDGRTLFGWTPNSETEWNVVDGCIVGSGETPGLLCTTTRWADYELRVDFRVDERRKSRVP